MTASALVPGGDGLSQKPLESEGQPVSASQAIEVYRKRGLSKPKRAQQPRPRVLFDAVTEGRRGGEAVPVGLLEWATAAAEEKDEQQRRRLGQAQAEMRSKVELFISRMRVVQGEPPLRERGDS